MIADMQIEHGRQEERASALQVAVSVSGAAALEMTYIAEHDFLTGLPNRLLLSDRISQAIASAQPSRNACTAAIFLSAQSFVVA